VQLTLDQLKLAHSVNGSAAAQVRGRRHTAVLTRSSRPDAPVRSGVSRVVFLPIPVDPVSPGSAPWSRLRRGHPRSAGRKTVLQLGSRLIVLLSARRWLGRAHALLGLPDVARWAQALSLGHLGNSGRSFGSTVGAQCSSCTECNRVHGHRLSRVARRVIGASLARPSHRINRQQSTRQVGTEVDPKVHGEAC
jgi:hypothetical protein